MAIKLSDDARKRSLASIRRYFDEQLDQDIGDLKAALVLDFFLTEIGPTVHNAAIEHAQVYLRDRVADLDGVCTEPEFGFWPKTSAPRARGPST